MECSWEPEGFWTSPDGKHRVGKKKIFFWGGYCLIIEVIEEIINVK